MPTVSCIIPTYNESSRIKNVLEVVLRNKAITEIIVIDDGSTDDTCAVVKKFPQVTLLVQPLNVGKTMAVVTGIEHASGEYLIFLDADLCNLTTENIDSLLRPVLDQEAHMAISLRGNTPSLWRWIGIDYISGERVMAREIFSDARLRLLQGLPHFGLEVFLNDILIKNKYKIKIVFWQNVTAPYKYAKSGVIKGLRQDFFMMKDIFATVSLFGPLLQIIRMRKLRI